MPTSDKAAACISFLFGFALQIVGMIGNAYAAAGMAASWHALFIWLALPRYEQGMRRYLDFLGLWVAGSLAGACIVVIPVKIWQALTS